MKSIALVPDPATMLMSMDGRPRSERKRLGTRRARGLLKSDAQPNLIIRDLNMGAMNGIELIREARKIPALRLVSILMLTTESQAARRTEAKAAGASGWLVKRVDGPGLLPVLSQLLPGGPA